MVKLNKIRFYEAIFIFLASLLYLLRSCFEEEQIIRQFINDARDQTGIEYLQEQIEEYNDVSNTYLPIILCTVFVVAAWYVFHYKAFARLKEGQMDEKTFIFFLTSILLTVTGVFIHLYLRRYPEYFYDDANTIIGMGSHSLFRQRNLFSVTVVILTLIGYYECVAQLFYYIHAKLTADSRVTQSYLSYFLLICLMAVILGLALKGEVPQSFFNLPMQNMDNHLLRFLFFSLSIGLVIFILQRFSNDQLLPAIQYSHWDLAVQHAIIYVISCLAATAVIWIAAHDFRLQVSRQSWEILAILLIVPLVIVYLRQLFTKENRQLQTQISHKSAELVSLRMQINPHFLFNALNTLYAAALRENAEKTSDGIQKLGDMMRFMLHENNQDRIPLTKETEYLYNYIAIQQMRLDQSHAIEVRVNIQQPEHPIYIAPMLLNPFVENAFKHGISFRQPSWVYITLTMDATRLYFKVHNSLHPKLEQDPEENKSGIGLENVRKRLELLYPNRHTLTIQQSGQDYFASLVLQYA